MAEYPFGMGAPPAGSVAEVLEKAKESVEDNPVTMPGPAKPAAGSYPVRNSPPPGGVEILGRPVFRADNRNGYRKG